MIFPDFEALAELTGPSTHHEMVRHPEVRARFQTLLEEVARTATGSSNQVKRAVLLSEPPSLDAQEVTDKGSINQRAVLDYRAALVEEIYLEPPPPHVLIIKGK
jgi:feruloyl-CoA synthase